MAETQGFWLKFNAQQNVIGNIYPAIGNDRFFKYLQNVMVPTKNLKFIENLGLKLFFLANSVYPLTFDVFDEKLPIFIDFEKIMLIWSDFE